MNSPNPGRILFVGAGPGNPDLLTVRARELLTSTATAWVDEDVLSAVTALVGIDLPVPADKLKAHAEQFQQMVDEAKAAGSRRRPTPPPLPTAAEVHTPIDDAAEMATLMTDAAQRGRDVIRLVTGNPLSREDVLAEINAVAQTPIEFQVIPGMSVPSTVPAFAGIALGSSFTETDVTSCDDAETWDRLAGAPQPLVLEAAVDDLPTISSRLQERGLSGSLPATVTVHGTTRRQRTIDTSLENLPKVISDLPATITSGTDSRVERGDAAQGDVIGDRRGGLVVTIGIEAAARSKYSWWENRALYGWSVLVPRAKSQAGPMSARLAQHGAIPWEVPTISVEPPRSPAQMERAIKGLVDGRYQWIVFTSVNAVKAVWEKFTEFGLDARAFAGVRIAAVGQKTARAVQELGISPELLPPANARSASGLVDVFPEYDEDLDPVDRVLLPRADIATDVLVDGLIELGWEVEDVVAYRTVRAAPPSADIRHMIKSGGFDAVCFTSSSTVKNLVGIAGKPHARTIIACIGPMAAATAKECGLRVDVMPEEAGVPELVDALADHVAGLRAAGQLPPPRKTRKRSAKSAAKSSAKSATKASKGASSKAKKTDSAS